MDRSRRQFLTKSSAVIGGSYLLGTGRVQGADSESDLPTPQPPDGETLDIVYSEAYGELVLSSDRRYWAFEIDGGWDEPMLIEYEVNPNEGFATPDVLIFDEDDFGEYKTKVGRFPIVDGPLLTDNTYSLGPVGQISLPTKTHRENIHLDNIPKWGDSQVDWGEGSPQVDMYALECLTRESSSELMESHVVEPGDYFAVFDWTDDVLESTSKDRVSVDVSVRAVNPALEKVENEVPRKMEELYTGLPDEESPLVEAGRDLASSICVEVPEEFHGSNLDESVPEAAQVLSGLKIVLGLVEDQLGYDASLAYQLTTRTTSWTRWSMSLLPVVSSLSQLVDDACAVTEADPEEAVNEIENMLLSLGILIADLLATAFGVTGRVASFLVGMARKYLLGFVARTLGLKAYVVLLKELLTLTRSGISEVLAVIKRVTREIGEEYELLDENEVERVEALDEEELESSSFDFDFFSLSPECSP
ncbi:hypothetical protein [Halobacterium hubeiense]|uniref:hypothetical protein n=1 Tax=Halobacterium hubeiense TaxID=1407499 RepID=UPI00117AD724|nr:hypothetical protein [Halobacterium hubeiense]